MQGDLEEAALHYRDALRLLNHSDWARRASVYESLANIAFLQVYPIPASTLTACASSKDFATRGILYSPVQ